MTAPQMAGGVILAPFERHTTTSPFRSIQRQLDYRTEEGPWFLDITDDVRRVVDAAGLDFGQVTIFSTHTTAAIRLQENEPLLIEDFKDLLRSIAPPDRYYRHNDFDIRTVNMHPNEPENGHSHCQHLFLSHERDGAPVRRLPAVGRVPEHLLGGTRWGAPAAGDGQHSGSARRVGASHGGGRDPSRPTDLRPPARGWSYLGPSRSDRSVAGSVGTGVLKASSYRAATARRASSANWV